MSSQTIQKQITDGIIAALENNLISWNRPWRSPKNTGLPTSVSTGRPYIRLFDPHIHVIIYNQTKD